MHCPRCNKVDFKTTDSRHHPTDQIVTRKRHCLGCGHAFRTIERPVEDDWADKWAEKMREIRLYLSNLPE